jgi:Prokaryotic E2 family E
MQHEHPIHIFINKKKYEIDNHVQTGESLKNLAGIPLNDVLFLQRPGEDEVIPNHAKITLKNGEHFHSQPPADYGLGAALLEGAGVALDRATFHTEPGGWVFVVISNYELPAGFEPNRVDLLVKLPPGFPDAAPDMFWVHPEVRTPNRAVPKATSSEPLLGRNWQRFSWHLASGAWKPGVSELRDFLRCIYSRFLRLD